MTERKTYTFRGATFAETFAKVTRELGRDATVLERRNVPAGKGRLKGLLGGAQEMVEIIAAPADPGDVDPAADEAAAPARTRPEEAAAGERAPGRSILEKVYRTRTPDALDALGATPESACALPGSASAASPFAQSVAPARASGGLSRGMLGEMLREVRDDLRGAVQDELRSFLALQARGGQPAVGEALLGQYRRLVENEVDPEIARRLVERLHTARGGGGEAAADASLLVRAVAGLLRTSGPLRLEAGRPVVIALVGPTGVGKTTTLAKLAVEYGFRRGRRVGVLNEDLRRPAAEAQLRTLGQFLSAEVATAERPEAARAEIERMRRCDLVLVDTAGRVGRDEAGMESLRAYLDAVGPDETHCVLGAGSSAAGALDAAARFRGAGADRLVVSKLDEAVRFGLLLTLAMRGGLPLSYVTTGPDFVECIRPADGAELAPLVAGLADGLATVAPPETPGAAEAETG
jgi:flagellar biosynthesis protein FlhF